MSSVFLLALGLAFDPTQARASCIDPGGEAGVVAFVHDHGQLQYCNGTEWIPFPKVDGTSPPAGWSDGLTLGNPASATGDWFGHSVAVNGTLAVIGATQDDPGGISNAGTAYVFDARTGSPIATLNNPDPTAGDNFGISVAVSGTVAVVGALSDDPGGISNAGTAYVFDAMTGGLIATLNNPAPAADDRFGASVAMSGTLALVGAYGDDPGGVSDAGTAYVFDTTTGSLIATLNNPAPMSGDAFGRSVALDGAVAVVGAYADDPGGVTNAGTAYVFDATTGSLIATLSNPDPTLTDLFGAAVAVSGAVAVVGAIGDDPGGVGDAGAAYAFDTTTGSLIATLNNPDPAAGDYFGHSVAVAGTMAVVGALTDDPAGVSDAGTAYVFDTTTGALIATLNNPAPGANDRFGHSVAMDAAVAVVGAYQHDPSGVSDAGAVFVFLGGGNGCADPETTAGGMFFNLDHRVLQWCDGAAWEAAGPVDPPGPNAGCTNPAGKGGWAFYNLDHCVLQYCDGDKWRAIGRSSCDGMPDTFAFIDQIDVAQSTVIESNTIIISGIASPAPVSVSGAGSPQYRVNNGSWTSSPGTIGNSQTLQIRLTSAGTESTTRSATIAVGGETDQWDVTTSDLTADPFSFADLANQALNTLIASNSVTINGITGSVAVSVSGAGSPQVSVDGGAWTAGPTTVINGQTLQVRLTSANVGATMRSATVTVGSASDQWDVTTEAHDTTPNAFAFTDVTAQALNTLITSNSVTVAGITGSLAVSVSGAGDPEISIAGGSWVTSGTITNGQSLQVRLTSANAGSTLRSATVMVGSVSDQWDVTTEAQDTTPNAFAFTDLTNQALNTVIASNSVTISGITGSVAVSVSGAGSPQVRINGGSWVTSGTITNGQTLQVRLTSADADSTLRSATVTVGSVSDQWDVTTGVSDPCAVVGSPPIGTVCSNGMIYAGISPDGGGNMYVAAADSTPATMAWGPTGDTPLVNCSGSETGCWTGDQNTVDLAALGATYAAATYCAGLDAHGDPNWYLPSRDELAVIYTNLKHGKPNGTHGFQNVTAGYWSSSEYLTASTAWHQRFSDGTQSGASKSAGKRVRCALTRGQTNSFGFAHVTNRPLNTPITSNSVTINGIEGTVAVSVSGAGSPEIRIAGGSWVTSGTITHGQTLQVRLTSASADSTTRSATVTVGSVSDQWDVTTVDTTPSAFSFAHRTNQQLNTLATSNTVTINGITVPVPVSVSGEGSPEIRIGTGSWVTNGTITNGQTLMVRLTSAMSTLTMRSAIVTVGSASKQWNVTTRDVACPGSPGAGYEGCIMPDGTIYAGNSPDGGGRMYAAAADSTPATMAWGPTGVDTAVVNCSGSETGCRTGKQNTTLLAGLGATYAAATYCEGLNAHGHTDWYLPSRLELALIYTNLKDGWPAGTHGFPDAFYWSSSEYTTEFAWLQIFYETGIQGGDTKTKTSNRVRCVRR